MKQYHKLHLSVKQPVAPFFSKNSGFQIRDLYSWLFHSEAFIKLVVNLNRHLEHYINADRCVFVVITSIVLLVP